MSKVEELIEEYQHTWDRLSEVAKELAALSPTVSVSCSYHNGHPNRQTGRLIRVKGDKCYINADAVMFEGSVETLEECTKAEAD